MIGPIRAGTLTYDIARTSSVLGKVRSRISRPTGTIIAPPMPCTMRAATSIHSELDEAAADRADREHDDRRAEHTPGAEAVGGPAADRDEHRQAQQVAGDRHVEPQRRLADRARDRRQRRRDDRRIEDCMNIAHATISRMVNWRVRGVIGTGLIRASIYMAFIDPCQHIRVIRRSSEPGWRQRHQNCRNWRA